ncbi:hypothetical protein HOLDEFILI_00930 [Holdemania filiformis DSM 12042]|uniref:Uncharacterized protein n=1 Tax=Holdemania filiformis DSM 12042 TaxID=545696 RepID=B9Y549_9FIRM|nr:hypothetical protein HOLDEFILI_00930 [Holdemania filiformis DSM 12042]
MRIRAGMRERISQRRYSKLEISKKDSQQACPEKARNEVISM